MSNDGDQRDQTTTDSNSQIQVPEKSTKDNDESTKTISKFRVALPQILASTAKNMILMDLGMTIAFPTIVIPALLNNKTGTGLSFTISDASWFGSIAFICQPIGSIASGIVLEPLGRKLSLIIVNFPHILGWLLLYNATEKSTVFIANVILGLGVGFMEAPIITYVGEICEPRLRGILISYSGLFFNLGAVLIYGLGNLTDWQTTALISTLVPVITVLMITQVPETPYWLLSRGRYADAEKSLCWLRGWVKPDKVQKEFQEMVKYSDAKRFNRDPNQGCARQHMAAYSNPVSIEDEKSTPKQNYEMNKKETSNSVLNADGTERSKPNEDEFVVVELAQKAKENENVNKINNNKIDIKSTEENNSTFIDYCKDLTRPEMLRPLSLVISFFFFLNFAGITAMRPYQIEIFENLGFPISPYKATIVMSVTGFVAVVLCMCCVKFLGKRLLALLALFFSGLSLYALSFYAKYTNSGEKGVVVQTSWIPFMGFFTLQFFVSLGVSQVPWMLVSEVFPYRGRSIASGFSAAMSYVLGFVATKTFLGLQDTLSLAGVLFFYGTCCFVGLLTMYKILPETEGRTLEDIENSYSTEKKS